MPDLPQVGTVRTSREGIGIVERHVHAPIDRGGLSFAFRELFAADVGVDGVIEVVGTATEPDAMTGRFVGVQVKAGDSWLKPRGDAHWVYYAGFAEFEYWRTYSVPVLLLLVDPRTDRIYWVRADDASHPILDGSVAIQVPRAQVLGPSDRRTIRQLADQVSGAFDSLIDPMPVQLARRCVRELTAVPAPSHAEIAEARIQLAQKLRGSEGHISEACLSAVSAAQDAWEAGLVERAAEALCMALTWAIEDLRDPTLGQSLLFRSGMHPNGTMRNPRELWTQPLAPGLCARLDAARATLGLLEGAVDVAQGALEPHVSVSGANANFTVHRAMALVATARGLTEEAARACDDAVAAAVAAGDEPESARLRIRAAWTRAMHSGDDLDPATVMELSSPPEVAAEAYRAAAWCALNVGDLSAASARFVEAATYSRRANDVPRAVRALRNAGRADFLAVHLRTDDQAPDVVAGRLEIEAQRQLGERVDLRRLEDDARHAAAQAEWATLRGIGERLRILGLLEYDPTAAQRGHTWLGVAWRAATRIQPDVASLAEAVRWTAAAGGLRDPAIRAELTALVNGLAPQISEQTWTTMLDAALPVGGGVVDQGAVLDAWLALGESVPGPLVNARLTDPLITAIALPWDKSSALDRRRKGCEIVVALGERLPVELATKLQGTIPSLLDATPLIHHEVTIKTALTVIHVSPPSSNVAHAIADATVVGLGDSSYERRHQFALLAVRLASLVDAPHYEALLAPIRAAADADELIMASLLADIEPDRLTVEFTTRYLVRMQRNMDGMLAQVGGPSFGWGLTDFRVLTRRASTIAPEDVRIAAGERSLSLIRATGHLRDARAPCLGFAAQLASTTRQLREDLWRVLGDAAVDGLVQDADVISLPTHPLSQGRIITSDVKEIAEYAVNVLVSTAMWASADCLSKIVGALIVASSSPFATVRAVAARALGGRIPTEIPPPMGAAIRADNRAQDRLRALSRDPVDVVRLAAYESLDESCDP